MLNWITNKLGLIKKSKVAGFRDLKEQPFTEGELSYMLAEMLLDADDDITGKIELKMFMELKKVEGFIPWLRASADKDIRRYFGATTPPEQFITRGAFSRTNYIKARVSGEKKTKIDGVKYG